MATIRKCNLCPTAVPKVDGVPQADWIPGDRLLGVQVTLQRVYTPGDGDRSRPQKFVLAPDEDANDGVLHLCAEHYAALAAQIGVTVDTGAV